eukprot:4492047-Amphidinium_carterae.1
MVFSSYPLALSGSIARESMVGDSCIFSAVKQLVGRGTLTTIQKRAIPSLDGWGVHSPISDFGCGRGAERLWME